MNKVYRVIWNASLGAWVAVSEITKSKGKKSNKAIKSGVLVSSLVLFAGNAIAVPHAAGGGTATGTDAIAIGESANATKANGIAIGSTALASESNAIAMGFNSNSSGENSTAIGAKSVASKQGSIALGQNTESSGADSVAIGSVAKATADNTVALGARSNASQINAIAVGTGTASSGEDAISVGTNAAASVKNTIALGVNSKSSAENATALGLAANASANDTVAIGTNAAASDKNTIALGLNSKSLSGNAVAIGLRSEAAGADSLAFGTNAKTSDVNAIALGINSQSIAGNAVAIGLRSEAAGADSLAFGTNAKTSDFNAIALGSQAAASKANTIALGTQTKAAGANAIALGNQAEASVFQSIALGSSAKASAADTVALGTGSIASGNSAIALGNQAQALGSNSISIGKGNIVSGKNSAAIGNPSNISGNNSYSLGNNNTIATNDTFVVGSNVTKTLDNSVFLGKDAAYTAKGASTDGIGAVTEPVTVGGTLTYGDFAGKTPVGVVSVGDVSKERRIQNVAAGLISATSTDAINGSQLYATNAKLGNVANTVVKNFGGNAALNPDGNITYTNIGNTGKDNIHDAIQAATTKVAGDQGVTVSPTTNKDGSTTYTVAAKTDGTTTTINGNNQIAAVTAPINSAGGVANTTGNTNSLATAGDVINAVNSTGFTAKANGDSGQFIKSGDQVNFNNGNNIAITRNGSDFTIATVDKPTFSGATVTNADSIANQGGTTNYITQGNTSAVNGGDVYNAIANTEQQYTGDNSVIIKRKPSDVLTLKGGATGTLTSGNIGVVADGTDTLNVQLAKDVNLGTDGSLTAGNTLVNNAGVTISNGTAGQPVTLTNTGLNNGGNTITNVAQGVNGTDAVNLSQLNQVAANQKTSSVKAGTNIASVDATTSGNNTEYTVNAKGTTVTQGDGIDLTTTDAGSNTTNYKVGLNQATKDSLAKADSALQTISSNNPNVVVSAKDASGNQTVGFVDNPTFAGTVTAPTFVTSGANPVTMGNGTVSGLTNTTFDPKATYTGGQAATQEQLSSASSQLNNTLTAKGMDYMGDSGTVVHRDLGTQVNVKGGATGTLTSGNIGVVADGSDTLNVQLAKDINLGTDGSLTAGNTLVNNAGVTISNGTKGQPVSLTASGLNNGGNTITNVAAGTADTDAVNVSQLKDVKNTADSAVQELTTSVNGSKVETLNKTNNDINFVNGNSTTARANGSDITFEVKQSNLTNNTNGTVNADTKGDSFATAENVANAINNSGWKATSGATGSGVVNGTTEELINPSETVTFQAGDNMVLNQAGNVFTYSLNKDININSVKFGNNGPTIKADANNNINIAKSDGSPTKITNVEAGTGDKDAVNVSQLKDAQAAATTKVEGDQGVSVTPTTNADGSKTYTVAAKTDGVTTQVDANGNIAAVTTGLTNTGTGTVATPTAPKALATAGDIANAINNAGFNLQANGDTKSLVKTGDTVQFLNGDNIEITRVGNDITVATAKNVTFDSVKAGPVVINNAGINAGDTQIKGVKAGTAGTDAVNVDQLTKAQAAATTKVAGDQGVTVSPTTNADGSTTYTVAAKTDGVTTQVDANGNIAAVTTGLTNTGTGTVATPTAPKALATAGDIANAINNAGFNLQANGDTKSLVKTGDTVQFLNGDNIEITRVGNDITVATAKNVTFDSVKAGPVVINNAGINAGDTQIKGVKDGTAGTDAVNVSQLKGAVDALGGGAAINTDGTIKAPTYNITNPANGTVTTANNVGDALKGLNDAVNSPLTFKGDSGDFNRNLGQTTTVKGGITDTAKLSDNNIGVVAKKDGTLDIKLAKDIAVDSVKTGDTTVNTYGVSIANADPNKVVSLTASGLNNGNNRITNVAAGQAGTDAVNKDQLDKAQAAATTKVTEGKNVTVSEQTNADGSKTYTVATKDDVNFNSVTAGPVVINSTGINAGNTKIKGVEAGTAGTDAVNVDQLKNQETTLSNKGLDFVANSGAKVHKNLGDTLGVIGTGTKADSEYSGDNIKTITDANGNIVVQLDKNLTTDSVTTNTVTLNGKPGVNGQPGTPGISITGAQGPAGVNGQPGGTTTRIEYNDGTGPQQIANLNDGLKFAGNQGATINKKLNETLSIKGDLANTDAATATNLRVDEENGELKVKLARNLKDLDSVTVGNNVLDGNGLTVGGPTGPSITNGGINAGNKTITNVAPGVNGTDAVNVDQLKNQETTLSNKGLDFVANSGAKVHKNLGDTLGVIGTGTKADSEYSGDNIKTITDANGNIVVQLDKNLTTDSVTTNTVTLNGKPGVNGQPGTPGISITGAQGPAGVNGQPGGTTTRIEYNDGTGPQQIANLNDGLKFAGNQGATINKKLNETLSIKGDLANTDAATATNLRVDEENGELKVKLARNLKDLDSVTVGNNVLDGNGLTVGGPTGPSITNGGINAGNKTITNVAPGVNGTDAVNVDQLNKQTAAATTEVKAKDGDKNISVEQSTAADGHTIYNVGVSRNLNVDTVTLPNTDGSSTQLSGNGLNFVDSTGNPVGPTITAQGIDAGNQKITNVAPGTISKDSKDAINGSQIYNLGNNVTNLFGGNASYDGDHITWNNIGGTGKNNIDDAIKSIGDQAATANKGWNLATDQGTASNVKPNDLVNINGDKASGIVVSNTGNNVTIGLSDKVKVGDKVSIDGTTGEINAGQIKIDGNKGTINNLNNTTWNGPNNIVSGQAATEDQLAQVVNNVNNQTTAAKTEVTQGDNIVVTASKAADGHSIYNVSTAKDVKFDSVTSNVVQVGNVKIDKDGINAGGQKVTNVAAGKVSTTSTDAVNGSQLYGYAEGVKNIIGGTTTYNPETGKYTNSDIGGTGKDNINDAIGAVNNSVINLGDRIDNAFYQTYKRIDKVEKEANAGIASAMAMETAPFIAGKWTYAVGAAYHGGEQAVGATLRKTADNGRWSLTGGVATATEGDPSVRIGISGVID